MSVRRIGDWFDDAAKDIAEAAGKPWAFIASLLTVVIWAALGPVFGWSDTHQLIINTGTTIVTFLLLFLVQNTQNRDNLALQAKLDALINELTERYELKGIERKPETEIRSTAENADS